MQYFYQNNNAQDLIIFFSGWGCDHNQFTNLHDNKDVLILYDYQDLNLNFDFSKYANIYLIAYSAGVFAASVFENQIPNIRQKVALCGNPFLFDETFGISKENIEVFKNITLDNYLDFRRKYMVYTDEEYEKYNKLESLRTIESCANELEALQKMYEENKDKIDPTFDKAIVAENDLIFNLQAQKDFYQNKLQIIKNAKHHIFFHFKSFEDMLDIKSHNTPKKGLILEGGAMRGMFTCGVIDVLMENNITFDGVAGISAGAVFGCNFKSKQIGRPIRYNKKYCKDPRYCSLRSLIKTGDLYNTDFCYRDIPDLLDPFDRETFKNNPVEFYIGATDVKTGKCLYHKCVDGGETDLKWMQASASMPLVSNPVSVDGHLLLDGAVADSVPYKFMEENGYNRNLIVLTQADGYRKNKSKLSPVIKFLLRKYPAIAEAMVSRYKMYNRQMEEIKEREQKGLSFVIRPPKALGISRTESNPDELERVYQTGRDEALKALPALKGFLSAC